MSSSSREDKPPTEWDASWSRLPGLRLHLNAMALYYRAPGVAVTLVVTWLLGLLSLGWSVVVWAALSWLLHDVTHYIGSLVIMPGQNSSVAALRRLSSVRFINKAAPVLGQLHRQLTAMYSNAGDCGAHLALSCNGTKLRIKAPDGNIIDGLWMPPRSGSPRAAAIYVPGNAEHYEFTSATIARQYHQENIGLLLFNYIGVGRSTGRATRNGMVMSLACAVDFLRGSEGFDTDRIVLVGHSIGGGVATEIAAALPGVHICNDRSFGSLSLVARHTLLGQAVLASDHWFHEALKWGTVALIKYVTTWELDAVTLWPSIKGSKWCSGLAGDVIIPMPCQLYTQLQALPISAAQRGKVLVLAPGGDAHNRPWTLPELLRHLRFIGEAVEVVEAER